MDLERPTGRTHQTLTDEQWSRLARSGWEDRVSDGLGIWVSIRDQVFRIILGRTILWETPCSTAANGPGCRINSYQTPLGWHSIAEKIGDGKPWGRVFRDKQPTNEIWRPGNAVTDDLVLTRVLALAGEEPGRNKGGDVDSFARNIYIHGTNDEANIGTPTSHGCIRLTNDDVIRVYDRIPLGTLLLITE